MALLTALPEQPDDLHGLLEHLEAKVGLGPAVAEDVLVERLAGPDAEVEAPVVQDRARRRRLRDHRRVDADRRTGHPGGDRQRRGLRQRPDYRPDEPAVSLLVVPGVIVVGDPQGVKAGLLGLLGLLDQLARVVFLAREEISDLHPATLPDPRAAPNASGSRGDAQRVERRPSASPPSMAGARSGRSSCAKRFGFGSMVSECSLVEPAGESSSDPMMESEF